jgi:hypothetical protein
MGERYQDVEKISVCLGAVIPSGLMLMRDMVATKTYLKSLVILMKKRRRPSYY